MLLISGIRCCQYVFAVRRQRVRAISTMIDADDFEDLISKIHEEDGKRERLIKKSRGDVSSTDSDIDHSIRVVLRHSAMVQASYLLVAPTRFYRSVHQTRICRQPSEEMSITCETLFLFSVQSVEEVRDIVEANPLLGIGSFSSALEEVSIPAHLLLN